MTKISLRSAVRAGRTIMKRSRSPSSYRPISLANAIYKLYASLPHLRLSKKVDPFLQPQQYGFRSNRSLSTTLFLLRRLTEIFELHTSSLHILFLDWTGLKLLTLSVASTCVLLSFDMEFRNFSPHDVPQDSISTQSVLCF